MLYFIYFFIIIFFIPRVPKRLISTEGVHTFSSQNSKHNLLHFGSFFGQKLQGCTPFWPSSLPKRDSFFVLFFYRKGTSLHSTFYTRHTRIVVFPFLPETS